MSRSFRAHLLLFLVVAVWGSTFVLVKRTLLDITPLLFNLLRMALAFLCLSVVYRRQWKLIRRAGWVSGALVGLMLGIAYQFQTSGLRLTTPSKAAFITGMTLVLVPLFSALPGLRTQGNENSSLECVARCPAGLCRSGLADRTRSGRGGAVGACPT